MQHFDAVIVFLVIIFILISLYKEWIGAAFTFFIAVLTLGLFGILTPSEILAGFANAHPLLPDQMSQGALKIMFELQNYLAEIKIHEELNDY
jgi:hypothetical protein